MKAKFNIILFIFLIILVNCNNSPSKESKSTKNKIKDINIHKSFPKDILEFTHENKDSTLILKDSIKIVKSKPMKNWTINDYILKSPKGYKSELKSTIKYEIEYWKNVKNPLIATYKGCDFGDYFHIEFTDLKGKSYDFGFGNNNFEKINLFDSNQSDNPKYLEKTFKVYWSWRLSTFPCCSGDYKESKAYLPSIDSLELD